MSKLLINIANAVPRMPELRFKEPVNWSLSSGQHWAIVGPNSAGKTIFSNILTGKIPLKDGDVDYFFEEDGTPLYQKVKAATFQDVYSMADYKNMYYQQRWNSSGEEEVPFVKELIANLADEATIHEMFSLFGIEELLEKKLILLSSGELRKFLIVRMLLSRPEVLILDNPYIGLDTFSRGMLNELLEKMTTQKGLQIILILSNPDDIPEVITHVLPVSGMKCGAPLSSEDFKTNAQLIDILFPEHSINEGLDSILNAKQDIDYDYVLEMMHVNIRYGERTILKDLDWKVKKGEKWALLGPNGAGKSTLLSLVCADNPQAYANSFCLFGKKRGTGESIWEIKKRIGYISPEMHLYYLQDQPCVNIVGSGFFDSIGLHRKCTEEQLSIALKWMDVFEITHLRDISFLKLSYGEQRLALLARAFVKNPDLLILDEPLHGLDKSNKILASEIIEKFCNQNHKTLIYVTHYLNEIPASVTQRFELKKQS